MVGKREKKEKKWLSYGIEKAMHLRDKLLKAKKHEKFKKQKKKMTAILRALKKIIIKSPEKNNIYIYIGLHKRPLKL